MSDRPVRILHFSSSARDVDCGIGKYQEQYFAGMKDAAVENDFFEISPYQTRVMSGDQLQKALEHLAHELHDYDILHIQHEFGLYWFDQFRRIVETAKSMNKKVVVTMHLSPSYAIKPAVRAGLGPRSILHYLRARRHYHRMVEEHIVPLRMADIVIAHNDVTVQSLKAFGIDPVRIKKLVHPVYAVPKPPASDEISTQLKRQKGDVIFAVAGFLHRYKGILAAVRTLKYLPDNYKLALIGGVKADSDEVTFQDKVTDLIDQLGLRDRVYITGFVEDDNRLNALIRECDVCVYPYDKVYYSSLSSGSLNLAIANDKPVIAYPTATFKEVAASGAIVLCQTFAYYELARELQRLDISAQVAKSKAYAHEYAWPNMAKVLITIYKELSVN